MDPATRVNNKTLIAHAVCGYQIQPIDPVRAIGVLKVTPKSSGQTNKSVSWPRSPEGEASMTRGTARGMKTGRDSTLPASVKELLPSVEVDWTSVTVESWRHRPQVVKMVRTPNIVLNG
jgi:hypothetical protein